MSVPGDTARRPALPARIAHKLRTLYRQPRFALFWVGPAWAMIGIASAMLALVPFRRIAPLLGENRGARPFIPLVRPEQAARARQIGLAVRMAARNAPFRADCFPQAITAQLLCKLYGVPSSLYLGVARAPAERGTTLDAHAWVASGPVTLTGGAISFQRYACVGCFVQPPIG